MAVTVEAMTDEQLKAFIQDLGLNDNAKVVVLVGYDYTNNKWMVIGTDENGAIKTAS